MSARPRARAAFPLILQLAGAALLLPASLARVVVDGPQSLAPLPPEAWRVLAQTVSTSLVLALVATALALAPAVTLARLVFAHAHRPAARVLHRLLAATAALPSIVIALAALAAFAPLLSRMIASPYHLALAALGLALLACPVLAIGLLGAAESGRMRAEPAAAALGLSLSGRAFALYLHCARDWTAAAVLWTVLRLVGETMVVLLLSGNRPAWPLLPQEAVLAATADIALNAGETPPALWAPLLLEALALIAIACGLSLAVRRLRRGGHRGIAP